MPLPLLPCAREEEDRGARPVTDVRSHRGAERFPGFGIHAVLWRRSREPFGMTVHDRVVHSLGMPARLGPVIVAATAPGFHAAVVVFGQHDLLRRLADRSQGSHGGVLSCPALAQ